MFSQTCFWLECGVLLFQNYRSCYLVFYDSGMENMSCLFGKRGISRALVIWK